MKNRPVRVMWNGNVFIPENRFLKSCRERFGQGEIFLIEPQAERDMNSHRHFFASIKTAWDNLPEDLMGKYKTPEHLRKLTLIETGWCDEKSIVCDTARDAAVIAAFMAPLDDCSIIKVSQNVIQRYTAKSQSLEAMGADDFKASKRDVLNAISALLQVTRRNLEQNAGIGA
jgi:hypothetical protein